MEPLSTLLLLSTLLALSALFPPVIAGAAEGLRHAVHRLAEKDGDLFVLAPVLVLPWADDEQTVCGTEVETVCGGVITVCETVVVESNHGETVIHGFIHDFALFRRYAGADKDGTMCCLFQAALFLLAEAGGILAMAHHWQAAVLRQERTVAEGIAGDEHLSGDGAAGHTASSG